MDLDEITSTTATLKRRRSSILKSTNVDRGDADQFESVLTEATTTTKRRVSFAREKFVRPFESDQACLPNDEHVESLHDSNNTSGISPENTTKSINNAAQSTSNNVDVTLTAEQIIQNDENLSSISMEMDEDSQLSVASMSTHSQRQFGKELEISLEETSSTVSVVVDDSNLDNTGNETDDMWHVFNDEVPATQSDNDDDCLNDENEVFSSYADEKSGCNELGSMTMLMSALSGANLAHISTNSSAGSEAMDLGTTKISTSVSQFVNEDLDDHATEHIETIDTPNDYNTDASVNKPDRNDIGNSEPASSTVQSSPPHHKPKSIKHNKKKSPEKIKKMPPIEPADDDVIPSSQGFEVTVTVTQETVVQEEVTSDGVKGIMELEVTSADLYTTRVVDATQHVQNIDLIQDIDNQSDISLIESQDSTRTTPNNDVPETYIDHDTMMQGVESRALIVLQEQFPGLSAKIDGLIAEEAQVAPEFAAAVRNGDMSQFDKGLQLLWNEAMKTAQIEYAKLQNEVAHELLAETNAKNSKLMEEIEKLDKKLEMKKKLNSEHDIEGLKAEKQELAEFMSKLPAYNAAKDEATLLEKKISEQNKLNIDVAASNKEAKIEHLKARTKLILLKQQQLDQNDLLADSKPVEPSNELKAVLKKQFKDISINEADKTVTIINVGCFKLLLEKCEPGDDDTDVIVAFKLECVPSKLIVIDNLKLLINGFIAHFIESIICEYATKESFNPLFEFLWTVLPKLMNMTSLLDELVHISAFSESVKFGADYKTNTSSLSGKCQDRMNPQLLSESKNLAFKLVKTLSTGNLMSLFD